MNHRFIIRNHMIAARAAEAVINLTVGDDKPMEVVIRLHKSKRTLEQNAYLHKLLHDIAEFSGDNIESVKIEMKARFLEPVTQVPMPDGRVYVVYPSTADMNVRELSEFCERIEAFAITELGFRRMAA